jgi:hypothetical protein
MGLFGPRYESGTRPFTDIAAVRVSRYLCQQPGFEVAGIGDVMIVSGMSHD